MGDTDFRYQLSRRRLMALGASMAAALPLSVVVSACGEGPGPGTSREPVEADADAGASAPSAPTSTPEPPFIVAAGEERRLLMEGTPYETPLYIYGTGVPGPVALALGGVHGNEPGGWLAAERVVDRLRPDSGALLVVPRANRVATQLFERTTEAIGDLNRAYPGDPNGTPSQQIAAQIVQAIHDFRVDLVVDMHESWAFYKDRPQNGTAFLGQTVATQTGPGADLARGVVEAVNARTLFAHEEFFFRDRFGSNQAAAPNVQANSSFSGPSADSTGPRGSSRSSLGLPGVRPSLIAVLVEMGQQQSLERRTALHVEVLSEFLRRVGVLAA